MPESMVHCDSAEHVFVARNLCTITYDVGLRAPPPMPSLENFGLFPLPMVSCPLVYTCGNHQAGTATVSIAIDLLLY